MFLEPKQFLLREIMQFDAAVHFPNKSWASSFNLIFLVICWEKRCAWCVGPGGEDAVEHDVQVWR